MNQTQIKAFTNDPDEEGENDEPYQEVVPMYKNFDNSNYIPTYAYLKLMVFNDDSEEIFSYFGHKAKIELNEYVNLQN